MSTQNALALTEIAKPLEKITLPIPDGSKLKESEVLIQITAAGPPLDQKLRDFGYFNIGNRLPAVISGDIVGRVIKNGPNAAFPIGTHIFSQTLFQDPLGGGLQEFVTVNGLYAAEVPKGVADTEAALYPINAMTTALALFTAAGCDIPWPGSPESKLFDYKSQALVIIGGGTNLGKIAVQMASWAGIGTIITTASLSGASLLKGFGATHVIARQDSNVADQVRAIVGDDLLYVYDTFSDGADLDLSACMLSNSKKGTLAHVLGKAVSEQAQAKKGAGMDSKRVVGFSHAIPDFGKMFWKELPGLLESGKIKAMKYHVIEGLDPVKVNAALDLYAAGKGGDRYHVKL